MLTLTLKGYALIHLIEKAWEEHRLRKVKKLAQRHKAGSNKWQNYHSKQNLDLKTMFFPLAP